MRLTLADILKGIITEEVSTDEVLDAIHNRRYVKIKYNDGKPDYPKGTRVIQPVAVGTTKKGYPVVRAFQAGGNSRRGAPKWKYFRLDRITNWTPYKTKTFNRPPDDLYNRVGDKSMQTFIDNAKFVDDDTPLSRVKNDWETIKNGPKLSAKNTEGPINAPQQRKKNVFNRQHFGDKHVSIAKNVTDDGNKGEDFWKMYDLASAEKDVQNNGGPIRNSSYDEDYYDIDDVDFEENEYENGNTKRKW